jgi:DNA processing protein
VDDRDVWYNLCQVEGLGSAKFQAVAKLLSAQRQGAASLLGLDASGVSRLVGLKSDLATKLVDQLLSPLKVPVNQDEIRLVLPDDDGYPNFRFLSAVPALPAYFWVAGSISLLSREYKTIGIAGSRDTSSEVVELVESFARKASKSGWLIVSGLAKGVDTAAHNGAIDGGTGTIGVLAGGILKAGADLLRSELDGIAIVSEFESLVPWSGPRAMQRNSTIAGLSDRVLVAASGVSGGSWEMAQLCLKKKKDLYVFDLPEDVAPGNRKLIKAGAKPLDPEDFSAGLQDLEPPMDQFF